VSGSSSGGIELPKGGGGDFDYNPTPPGRSKKEKKPKDDLVQQLEEELEEKITNWNKEQVAQDQAQEYSLQSIADYWAQALQRTDLSAKDKYEIQKKYNAAEAAVQKEAFAEKLEGYKRELDEADKNAAAKLAIVRKEAADTKAFYGETSKEAIAADEAVFQAEKAAADQRIQLEQNVVKAQQQLEQSRIDEAEKNAQLEEQLGLTTKGQLLQQERQFEDERYAIDLAALERRKALIDPDRDPIAYEQISAQIEALEQQHQQKLTAIDRQAMIARTEVGREYASAFANASISGLDGILSKTKSWQQAMAGIYQSLVQTFEGQLQKMLTNWIVTHVFMTSAERAQLAAQTAAHAASEATKTAATTTGVATRAGVENTGFFAKLLSLLGISLGAHTGTETAKTGATIAGATSRATAETTAATATAAAQLATNVALAASYSGVAGAAGVASWAAAPWPVDAGAPAFGASMAAAAAGFGSIAAAEGGDWDVGEGLYHLHEKEMVLPAWAANPLRSMLSEGSAPAGAGGGQGGVHLHYSPTINDRQQTGLRQLLASEGGAMIDFLNRQVRDGKLKLQAA
jgi:hypothetical protein